MGWIRDRLSADVSTGEDAHTHREERFPSHTYGPGYPVVIHRDEIAALYRLLDNESETLDGWDKDPFMRREEFDQIVEGVAGETGGEVPTPEDRRGEMGDILDLWQSQLNDSQDAVWATIVTQSSFRLFINYCEVRAETEGDDFEELPELDTAREIFERIRTAREDEGKLALVHKRDLPLEEPAEDTDG